MSHNFIHASRMHTLWHIILKLGIHMACDEEVNIMANFAVTTSKVTVKGIMANISKLQLCLSNAYQLVNLSQTLYAWWLLYDILLKVKVTMSKVEFLGIMAATRALCSNTSWSCMLLFCICQSASTSTKIIYLIIIMYYISISSQFCFKVKVTDF